MNNQLQLGSGPVMDPAPPAPGGYPYLVPYPVALVPPATIDQMMALARSERDTAINNEKLRHQLEQKYLAEEAYSSAVQVSGDCICTQSKYGALVPILNCTVKWSAHIIPRPPLKDKSVYVIQLSVSKQLISLTEDDFFKDSVLLSKFQEVPGVKVTIRKTRKSTADLIRQAIQYGIRILRTSIYAGWSEQGNGNLQFVVFDTFSSHRKNDQLVTHVLPATPPAVTDLAIKNWKPAFSLITDPFMRWFLTIWFHMAIQTTLLDKLGCRPPLGLYIFSDDYVCAAYLRRLFCWYGDPMMSVDMPPDMFIDEVLRRKDQPLVIEDTGRTKHVTVNAATVEGMLSTHLLLWKNGRDYTPLPVQSLPSILASTVSGLVCDPNLITLDLTADPLLLDRFPQDFPTEKNLQEYLTAFVNYTSENITEFRSLLEAAHKEAWALADGTLTESCVDMLKIMLALHRFLEHFYGTAILEADMRMDELVPQLLAVLQETSSKMELSTNLVDHFITLARHMIQHGRLNVYPLERRELAPQNVTAVYVDEKNLYFTSAALKAICQQLDHSRPIVLRALTDAGLMQGRPINGSTFLTRVQLYNVYGATETVSVYCMQKAAFEKLGDPLRMMEGDDPQL